MTILSHTEKELIIYLHTIKINNVVTFEIFNWDALTNFYSV